MARILVVDDDADVQATLAAMLTVGGHLAISAAPGREALRDLEAGGFDLVITDLKMPVLTGWNIADWLRQHRAGTPIIALSGEVLDPAWLNKFTLTLQKPVRRPALLAAVEQAMQHPSG